MDPVKHQTYCRFSRRLIRFQKPISGCALSSQEPQDPTNMFLLRTRDTMTAGNDTMVAADDISELVSVFNPLNTSWSRTIPSIKEPEMTRKELKTMSLVYYFILVFVSLQEPQFESDLDLTPDRFARLDGTMATWPAAVKLFDDLLYLSNLYVGIRAQLHRQAEVVSRALRSFGRTIKGEGNRVFKTPFFTAESSKNLLGEPSTEHICQEDDSCFDDCKA